MIRAGEYLCEITRKEPAVIFRHSPVLTEEFRRESEAKYPFRGSRRITADLGDQNTEKAALQDTHIAFLDVTGTRFCWLPARDTAPSLITESSCKYTKTFSQFACS